MWGDCVKWPRGRSAAVVCAFALAVTACSSYSVSSDAIRPAVPRAAPAPLRVAVAVPDLSDPSRAALGHAATSTLQELYLDFIAALERSGVFAKVDQVQFSPSRQPSAGSADILATLVHRPELPGGRARFIQQVIVAVSLFGLAPVMDAHETYGVTAELSLEPSNTTLSRRRYVGVGMATLASKIYAPREEAVRDALVAAGRLANSHIVEQLTRDNFSMR